MSKTWTLKPKSGGDNLTLAKPRMVLGHHQSVDIVLPGLSPFHAVLEQNALGEVWVFDLASKEGTVVNGMPVVSARVSEGDTVKFGNYEFQLVQDQVSNEVPKRISPLPAQPSDFSPVLDYSVCKGPEALEVSLSYRDTVLDVEHYVSHAGGSGSIQSSPLFGKKGFPVIVRQKSRDFKGGGFGFRLLKGMEGVIQREGKLRKVREIVNEKGIGTLQKGDIGNLSLGDLKFYIKFSEAPPQAIKPSLLEKDPFLFKILGTSLGLTLLLIIALVNIKVAPQIEPEQLPERIVSILLPHDPSLYLKPETDMSKGDFEANPTQTSKNTRDAAPGSRMEVGNTNRKTKIVAKGSRGQSEAKAGEGARAKGQAGVRGTKNSAPFKDVQTKATRPGVSPQPGSGGVTSEMGAAGNVQALKDASAKFQNLLGASEKIGKGSGKVAGFGAFSSKGREGLALSGTSKGGGGSAALLGGLSDKGSGGARIGTGKGAAGDGAGIIGGSSRVLIRSGGPEEVVVMGSIDAAAIEAAIQRHRDEFRLCYEKEINAYQPSLSGRIGVQFEIGQSGRVTQSGIQSSTLKNANVERCTLKVLNRIQFPEPLGGGIVSVGYSFKFHPN